jgi:hypothetical protein
MHRAPCSHGRVAIGRFFCAVTLAAGLATSILAQASPEPPGQSPAVELERRAANQANATPAIALSVPAGTPLEIALDREVRVARLGQPVHGRTVEPIYAFDQLVIPAGSEVTGQISKIEGLSKTERIKSALDANFTPARKIEIEFDNVALSSGKQITLHTIVMPGSGQLLDFVAARDEPSPKGAIATAVTQKANQAKQLARQQWTAAMGQIRTPGKIRRAERYALDLLPIHPQYIDAGSVYFAELQTPLGFGAEPLSSDAARSIGNLPSSGEIVRARLADSVSSAVNRKGDAFDAVVTQPVFEDDRLVVPQGSVLSGTVVQVRPARRFSRNGQLRVAFHALLLPDGVQKEIEASLESVQTGKSADVKLDSEGGAQATTPKTRYLSTAIALGLAGISVRGDPDAATPNPAGNPANRMAGGAVGYKLVGITLGLLVHSRAFGYSMGAYGAGMSVYAHFVARGRDVVFPKDTALQIALGSRDAESPPPPPAD